MTKIAPTVLPRIRFMSSGLFKTLTILPCCTASLSCVVSPSSAFVLPDTGQSKCYATVNPYAEINCSETGQDGMYSSNTMSYTPNGNGTVTDNNTSLMWQQQDGGVKTWANAITYCTNLELAGFTDWRLASKKELLSLVDYGVKAPAAKINNGFFPGTTAYGYWTSTPQQGSAGTYWYVDFLDGGSGTTFHPEYTYNARCVRGGAVNNQNTGIRIEEPLSGYASIQAAYDAASTGQTIQARTMEIPQELDLKRDIDIVVKVGYTGDFLSNPGITTIAGSMTLSGSGSVTIENFAFKNP